MDFLATIAPPVVSQPQAFTDAMLDPTSRGLLAGLTTAHMSGAILQTTLRQSADQLQRTVQGQFVSLKVQNSSSTVCPTIILSLSLFTLAYINKKNYREG